MKRLTCVVTVAVLSRSVIGCKDFAVKGPALAPARGTVNLDGKPMPGGEIRFTVPGQPTEAIEIKDGAFSGQASMGRNRVEVVWEQDGPPNPMDPSTRIKANTVSAQFFGEGSPLSSDVGSKGAADLKFDVTSARW